MPIAGRRRSSRRNSPARCRALRSRRSSRASSRSTTRSARVPPATGSAQSCISTPTSSCMTTAADCTTERPFEGVLPNMERRYRETDSAWVREELGRYQNDKTCEVCDGARLKPEALAVKIAGKHISEAAALSIAAAVPWFAGVEATLTPAQREIAQRILKEINERLGFLKNVGLEYLTLMRASGTLS